MASKEFYYTVSSKEHSHLHHSEINNDQPGLFLSLLVEQTEERSNESLMVILRGESSLRMSPITAALH